ncbi:hypothetical protein [Enterovibrio coralii]|uniref:Uncharacterized protein n=1 Tax=Enterovibrio coralii TaxID=294935 RepID=A0A135I577_9GAMM|nr:hypothetical protein [Enterovibrio coralii]KXF80616.1 hypothetical protein ATN88_08130 [Enterovibrio coralii]
MPKQPGDIDDKSLVEYAVITVILPNKYLPKKLQLREYGVPESTLRDIGVTTICNLTEKGCYIESMTLAREFLEYARRTFRRRGNIYIHNIRIDVRSSKHQGTRDKVRRDSEAIRNVLANEKDKKQPSRTV